MNVFVYTPSYYVRNTFIHSLIPKGISLFHAERPEILIEKMLSQKADIVILDLIQEDYNSVFSLTKSIKTHASEDVKKIAVILLIGTIEKQYISLAIQLGVVGFIKSNASEEFISNYIVGTYQKVIGTTPERKFVRVSIDASNPNERVGIKFRSPVNSQLIIGTIKDISFGGIAVELIGSFPEDSLASGQEVRNMQFILEGKDVFVDAIVVAFQKKFCAFRFVDMSNQVREIISLYIFDRISSIEKGE